MLQYPVQLPPLSLTSSKPKHRSNVVAREVRPGDGHHDNDPLSYRSSPSLASSTFPLAASPSLTTKRTDKRSAYAHSLPLAIATVFPPSSPSLPSSSNSSHSPSLPATPILSSAVPSPVLRSGSPLHTPALQSKPIPRSPYVQQLPMPVPSGQAMRSPRPSKSIPLPSPALSNAPNYGFGAVSSIGSYPRSTSSTPSSFSSTAVDVLAPGDLVGEGLPLENELIRKVPIAPAFITHPAHEELAPIFEVVRVLGTGSYATVYLVREVLYRAPASLAQSDDGMEFDMSVDGHSSRDHGTVEQEDCKSENQYGREYAIKVLSKGNLDQEALAAQMFEVRFGRHSLHTSHSFSLIARI